MTKRCLILAGLLLALLGCAQPKPFELPRPGEIPDGPGLFTGEKGRFILYRR